MSYDEAIFVDMCGIFAYTGNRTAEPILIDGLRMLEYRGYDSAGIFVPGYGAIKAVGPIDNLAKKIRETIPGTSGIAHTRWATHGAPTEINAHPHCDMSGSVWLVHNGIIENYRVLKEHLVQQGVIFESDTDTEVLAKLVGSLYTDNLVSAVQEAIEMVEGTYGIAVMSSKKPEEIVVARMGSPIVLGVGTDGYFVSSDPSALLPHTKDVIYLGDGELALLSNDTYTIFDKVGKQQHKEVEHIVWSIESVQKQGYAHFMEKEIFEAPDVVRNAIRGRLIQNKGKAKLGGLEKLLHQLAQLDRLAITACGSAYYAGYVGKYILEEYARLPIDIELASEYRYKTNLASANSALLAVTQSGETADTLAAIRIAKEKNILTLGIVNAVGSTIARETDAGVYNHAGPEIAVASTKAFISELTVFVLLALFLGRERGMSVEEGNMIIQALERLPDDIEKVLDSASHIKALGKKYATMHNCMFIGRNTHTPIAYEGALKLKEISYIHADAYAGGELKHGSIALLDEHFPVIALAPHDAVYDKMVSNIQEVKARNAPVIVVTNPEDTLLPSLVDDRILVPKVHPIVQPILSTIPLHLFAYYIGVERGRNVDRPRNLAKSVTVE